MKNLFLLLLLAFGTKSFAQNYDGYAYRYDTTYEAWDYGFHDQYGYEETYYDSYSSQCGYRTCYYDYSERRTYRSTRRVYVEETIIEESGPYYGHTRVTVYRTSSYESRDRYVTYYTNGNRVMRRQYHHRHRPHYLAPNYNYNYVYTYPTYTTYNYVYLDEASAQIITGLYAIAVGAEVLGACTHIEDDDAQAICLAGSAASSVAGSISISNGIEEAQRQSDLERKVKELETSNLNEDF